MYFVDFCQIVRSLEDAKTRCSQVHTDKHNIPRVSWKRAKDGTSILFSNILKQKTWFFHNRNSQEVGTNTPDVGRHICRPLVNTLARILQFPLTRAGETTTRNVSMSYKLSEGDGNGKGNPFAAPSPQTSRKSYTQGKSILLSNFTKDVLIAFCSFKRETVRNISLDLSITVGFCSTLTIFDEAKM